MNLFAGDFAVGDRVTAVAAFLDGERRRDCVVDQVDQNGIWVRAVDNPMVKQRFDRSGAYYCPYNGQKTAWLEKAA